MKNQQRQSRSSTTKPIHRLLGLFGNTRFYILSFSLLLSLVILAIVRINEPSDQVFLIRTQQLYGLVAIGYWYVALLISPLKFIIGKERMRYIEFSRRAIGVSAFYFAILHTSVALWGQLGGLSQLVLLPELFRWSLLGGAFALLILTIMAATSFDWVVKKMTFRRWKLLHRLVYIAGIVAILHIWLIGTHLAYPIVQYIALAAIGLLLALEVYRAAVNIGEKSLGLRRTEAITVFGVGWAIALILLILLPNLLPNYHSKHLEHSSHSVSQGTSQ